MKFVLQVWFFFAACLSSYAFSVNEAGPYEIKLEAIEKCADEGTKDFSVAIEYDAEKDTFSGAFHKKKDLDDNAEVNLDIQRLVGKEWKKEFSQNVGGMCTLIKSSPSSMQNILQSVNVQSCPVPEGTNVVKELKNNFRIPFMKALRYGRRRVEVSLEDKDGNKMGCLIGKVNVIPASN